MAELFARSRDAAARFAYLLTGSAAVADAAVEQSGGLTFVTAETDSPREPMRFLDATGVELSTG